MNEARVYADGFERSFAEVKDLLEFLAERGRNAKWIRKPTNDGMKLGIRLLLTILLSGNSDEDLANSSISTTFPFSLVYTPSFNMM